MLNRFWPCAAVACLVPGACTTDAAEVVAPIAEPRLTPRRRLGMP